MGPGQRVARVNSEAANKPNAGIEMPVPPKALSETVTTSYPTGVGSTSGSS
ncbi:MAG: hypothetical protein JWR69_3179 [Pedosphaera sp.]|nr:hypothetical protein [Pedosphaera sp.]